jgi:hypothetical protein
MTWDSPIHERYDDLQAFYTRQQGKWAVPLDNIWQSWVLTTQRRDCYIGHMPLQFSPTAQNYIDDLQFGDFTSRSHASMPQFAHSIMDELVLDRWCSYPEDSGANKQQLGYRLEQFLPGKPGRTELVRELCDYTATYAAAVERGQLRIAMRAYGPDYVAPYGPHQDLPISDFAAGLFVKGPTTWQRKPTDLSGRITDNSLPAILPTLLTGSFAAQARRYGQVPPQSFSLWSGLQEHTECPVQGQMRLAVFIFADAGYRAPALQRSGPSRAYTGYGYSR